MVSKYEKIDYIQSQKKIKDHSLESGSKEIKYVNSNSA